MKLWKIAGLLLAGALLWVGWSVVRPCCGARERPTALEVELGPRLRNLSIPSQARKQGNPLQSSPQLLAEAAQHFADHCASCHGNNGSGETEIGRHLHPPAPDMRLPATQKLSDGELYWIIHNGIRWTGMPAWGEPSGDTDSWKLVLFIRHLPELSPADLREMERFNPVSRHDLEEENAEREFLNGAPVRPKH